MKRIEIIIPDRKLYAVSNVLKEANITGMSYYGIQGRSKVKIKESSVAMGSAEYELEFMPKLKVEVVVKDEQVEELITKIVDNVGGDIATGGKIFVVDVSTAVDLTTKKRGETVI
jgi:nitrogen regulatory protein P-II 1